MTNILLFPYPKNISFKSGSFNFDCEDRISIPVDYKTELFAIARKIKHEIKELINLDLNIIVGSRGIFRKAIIFIADQKIPDQGYRLTITPDQIQIRFKEIVGAFYGIITLKQLIKQCGRSLPCLEINDEPDYHARGIMLDIGRNKIPTRKTLFEIVDMMAELKLNQLQLYIEGFPFAYSTYPEVWQSGTPLTGEDIIELDEYCKKHFIELVPNQNSFGHMAPWLAKQEFNHLADCPDGFEMWDSLQPPGTLDPQNPGSIELIENNYDDLLPYFSSKLFNVGCDETFELGMGKSKELCEEKGNGRVYLDYLMQITDLVKKRGKTMMFWGDIINRYPELVSELPTDIIALEWGYESDHSFDRNCEKYKKSGIPFYVCPGTSSWRSITGRTNNMMGNLLNAAINGKKHGAIGYLNTDWGDHGHWQYLPVSYAGFSYGAALCWNIENNQNIDIVAYLNKFIFEDNSEVMGQFALDLGNYYLLEGEPIPNSTNIARIMYNRLNNMRSIQGIKENNLYEVKDYIAELLKRLSSNEMKCKDASLVEAEFRNSIRFINHGTDLAILKIKLANDVFDDGAKVLLARMIEDMSVLINNHKKLWLERNMLGDLDASVAQLEKLKAEYLELQSKE